MEKVSATGSFAGYTLRSTSAGFADPEFEEVGEPTEGELKGEITFKPPLNSDSQSVSFEESYRVFNAFALTEEQRFRMHGKEGPEYISIKVTAAVARLLICLQFPPELVPSNVTLEVGTEKDSHWTTNARETTWAQPFLHISRLTGTVMLTVPQPLHDHTYKLRWPLPPASDRADGAQIQGRAEGIRQKLLERDMLDRSRNPLQPLFDQALSELGAIFPSLRSSDEVVDLGLMVYDSTQNQLRYVAGKLRDEFWSFRLYEGRGAAGRAHKLNQALLYVPRRMTELENYGLKTPAGIDPPELQLCVPLRYPIGAKDGWVVGVLTFSTSSLASSLLKLRESEETKTGLLAFLYAFYGGKILPALGMTESD